MDDKDRLSDEIEERLKQKDTVIDALRQEISNLKDQIRALENAAADCRIHSRISMHFKHRECGCYNHISDLHDVCPDMG